MYTIRSWPQHAESCLWWHLASVSSPILIRVNFFDHFFYSFSLSLFLEWDFKTSQDHEPSPFWVYHRVEGGVNPFSNGAIESPITRNGIVHEKVPSLLWFLEQVLHGLFFIILGSSIRRMCPNHCSRLDPIHHTRSTVLVSSVTSVIIILLLVTVCNTPRLIWSYSIQTFISPT